jgi:hypothetical protein
MWWMSLFRILLAVPCAACIAQEVKGCGESYGRFEIRSSRDQCS